MTTVDSAPVRDPDDLAAEIAKLAPGATATLEIWRDGRRQDVKVRLGERALIAPDQPG